MDRVTVTDQEELEAALERDVEPGSEIVFEDGTYEDLEAKIALEGTRESPITIRPESKHGAVLTGRTHLRVTGLHVVVSGLRFEGSTDVPKYGAVSLWTARHCRVTGCAFEDLYGMAGTVTIQHGASQNRIDNNRFVNCRYRAVRVGVHDEVEEHGPPRLNRIDHNVVRDIPDASDEPEASSAEAVQIGQWGRPWSAFETRTRVEHNLFLRCNGENEIISVKTRGNVIRDNAFVDCVTGELVLRHSDRTTVEGNWFERCNHGVRVLGDGHRVVDNTVVEPSGMGIRLPHGTDDLTYPTSYMRVRAAVVANNTIVDPGQVGVQVGGYPHSGTTVQSNERFTQEPFDHRTGRTERTVAPHDSVFVNNVVVGDRGTLFDVRDAPENVYFTNLLHAREGASVGHAGGDPVSGPPAFRSPSDEEYRIEPESLDHENLSGRGYPIGRRDADGRWRIGAGGTMPDVGPVDADASALLDQSPIYSLDDLPRYP